MDVWIHECPKCGYVAVDIEDHNDVAVPFLQSKEYRTCDRIDFQSDLAKRFYKFYKINERNMNIEAAFTAAVHAAWVCDDTMDAELFRN